MTRPADRAAARNNELPEAEAAEIWGTGEATQLTPETSRSGLLGALLLLPASCSQTIIPEEAIMNALELLKRDHDSITALLAGANAYADMKRLFERIKSELEIHAHIEETAFYPLCKTTSY